MAVSTAVYQDIIDWALAQQKEEASGDHAVPLTDAENKALLNLHQLVKPPVLITPPPVEAINWVGKLHEFYQARHDTEPPSFIDEPVEVPSQPLRWCCYAKIHETPNVFPGPDNGLVDGGEAPSFTKKKDAKQYAARCALEWLQDQSQVTKRPTSAKLPTPHAAPAPIRAPPTKRLKTGPIASQVLSSPLAETSSPPGTAPTTSSLSSSSSVSDSSTKSTSPDNVNPLSPDERAAVVLARECCSRLGVPPPRFRLVPVDQKQEFFSGHAIFDSLETRNFPPELGKVENVYGKKMAEQKVAENLLTYLQGIEKERSDRLQKFTGQSGLVQK